MIWLIIVPSVIVLAIGIMWIDAHAYQQGFRAGRRYEQKVINDAMAMHQRRRLAAERSIDYLYERTRRQIRDLR